MRILSIDMHVTVNEYPSSYGKVAAIENIHSDFSIYRKFGWLRNYALLHLQDELVKLEAELESHEYWEITEGSSMELLSCRRDYSFQESKPKELMETVYTKMAQYGKLLAKSYAPSVHSSQLINRR